MNLQPTMDKNIQQSDESTNINTNKLKQNINKKDKNNRNKKTIRHKKEKNIEKNELIRTNTTINKKILNTNKNKEVPEIKGTSKRHNKEYCTPKQVGEKWQIDVKYVPMECKTKGLPKEIRYYQYTCIDEASRERFLYWYEEHTPMNTVDFVQRCIKYFGYKAKEIQTDNGIEFTYNQAEIKKEHPMDTLLNSLNIKHHKIRPRTPEHNGKVERSHRNDNERFYSWLTFYSLEDLRKQGAAYLKRSNTIPMAVLGYLTPKEKRAKLMCT